MTRWETPGAPMRILARYLSCHCLTSDPHGRTIRTMVKLLTLVTLCVLFQPWHFVGAQDYQDRQIDALERRLDAYDNLRIDARLTELMTRANSSESDQGRRIDRLENLGWGIMTVVGAQLLLHGISLKRNGK